MDKKMFKAEINTLISLISLLPTFPFLVEVAFTGAFCFAVGENIFASGSGCITAFFVSTCISKNTN